MELKKEDFSGCLFNVFAIPQQISLFAAFPALKELYEPFSKALKSQGGIDLYIRYIVYLYDKNSPLHAKFPDIKKKKIFAAKLAGFDYDSSKGLSDLGISVINNRIEEVRFMISLYLRMQHNLKWTYIATMTEAYYSAGERILEGDDIKNNTATMKSVRKEIEDAFNEMTYENTIDNTLLESYIVLLEGEKGGWRPEDVISRIKDGIYIGLPT